MNNLAKTKKRVAVGLSGGVDSAVAAALLKKAGHDVVGVHLYCYDEGPWCTANEDRASAVRVAQHLNIPILIWDLRKEYKAKVMGYFFDEYKAGRTPNPDVVCNREIKFGIFLKRALEELRVDYVATGHYARLRREVSSSKLQVTNKKDIHGEPKTKVPPHSPLATRYSLLSGLDKTKDQSYFLYTLTQKQLEHILFPIGDYRKEEVRKMAIDLKLPNAKRPDSQGICFIGPVQVSKFLREKIPAKVGPVVDTNGQTIGEHDGVWFYTEGQRHGFSIFKSLGLPMYVIKKDALTNTLIVGRGTESKVREFEVEKLHWISQLEDSERMQASVRIRHLGEIMPARLSSLDSKPFAVPLPAGIAISDRVLVTLAEPTFGVAPGQSAVFYRSDEVLGGGTIGGVMINQKLKVGGRDDSRSR